MNTSDKCINVSKFLSVSVLGNRATARFLIDEIKEMNASNMILDFSLVKFASRSFMDELNAKIKEDKDTTYSKVNMNEQVAKMDQLVQDKENRNFWSSDESKPENIKVVTM
jgi:6-pyruvoyl-tetrahydropterin synthase